VKARSTFGICLVILRYTKDLVNFEEVIDGLNH